MRAIFISIITEWQENFSGFFNLKVSNRSLRNHCCKMMQLNQAKPLISKEGFLAYRRRVRHRLGHLECMLYTLRWKYLKNYLLVAHCDLSVCTKTCETEILLTSVWNPSRVLSWILSEIILLSGYVSLSILLSSHVFCKYKLQSSVSLLIFLVWLFN